MTGARLRWADVAKGSCIVLVVLWHVTRKDYLELPWHLVVPATGLWGMFSEVLLPVRMPLFFFISGLFAARQLDRPWSRVLSRRVGPLLYVFVLWTLVQAIALRAAPGFDTEVPHGPGQLLVQLTVTPGNLWYLGALAAYVVVARATRSVPHWALALALVLSTAAAAGLVPTPGNRYSLLTNLVWFLLGTRLADLPRVDRRVAAALVGAFVIGAALWQLLDADRWLGVRPVLGLLGIAAGGTVATLLSQVPRLGPALAALGQRTLPVYVLHLPLVALAHLASTRLVTGRLAGSSDLALAYPAALTALVLGACLALHRLLVAAGGGWLFTAPWLPRARPAPARSSDQSLPSIA
jgi:uncharacterized membrane protein YcfT